MHRESINLSMASVSWCIAVILYLWARNFWRQPTLQPSTLGTMVFTPSRAFFTLVPRSQTGSSWTSLAMFARFDPVALLTSLEQRFATTLTAKLLLSLRLWKNLMYLARILDLRLGVPAASKLSTKYLFHTSGPVVEHLAGFITKQKFLLLQ